MKKIAIITLTGNDNYGNRLQNYALQKVLELNNYKVDTIWREKENNKLLIMKVYNFKEKFFQVIKSIKKKRNLVKLQTNRKEIFKDFNKEYISISTYKSKGPINNSINDDYDYFIAGSDQIWNYNYPTTNTNDFLKFADYNKTISYAASFGVNHIENKWIPFYKKNLSYIKHISVREIDGQKIIKNIIKKDVAIVLDPTLLLNKKIWNEIAKKPTKSLPKKYLLTYFLGNVTLEMKINIEKMANKNNLEIVDLKGYNDEYYYMSGPSEFVYLLSNADLVITDSFHGTAFSIIFEKNFFVYNRNFKINMSSRIYSLLNLLDLNERFITDKLEIKNQNIDYKKCYEKLEKECENSMKFLKHALDNQKLKSFYK